MQLCLTATNGDTTVIRPSFTREAYCANIQVLDEACVQFTLNMNASPHYVFQVSFVSFSAVCFKSCFYFLSGKTRGCGSLQLHTEAWSVTNVILTSVKSVTFELKTTL